LVFHGALIFGRRELRDPEVEHLHAHALRRVVLRDEVQVLGLEVPVHDAVLVRRVDRGRDLAGDRERGRRRQRALAGDPLRERLALEQLHDDVRAAVGVVAEIKHLARPGWWIRAAARASLKNRSTSSSSRTMSGSEALDRDATADQDVLGLVHTAIPPSPMMSVIL